MRAPAYTILCAASLIALSPPVEAAKSVRVSMIIDGPWERGAPVMNAFREEILVLTKGEFDVTFPPDKQRLCNFDAKQIRAEIAAMVADKDVDLIITMGIVASHVAATGGPYPKPVVAPYIVDGHVQGAPITDKGASGVDNLSYITSPDAFERDLEIFRELAPFKHLVVLTTRSFHQLLPELDDQTTEIGKRLGFDAVTLGVGDDVAATIGRIPLNTDAVYLAPLLEMPEKQLDTLIAALNAKKLPTFSLWGKDEVERGVLASGTGTPDYRRRARRVAIYVQRILLGEQPGTLRVNFPRGERLVINMATARTIGFYPSWKALTEAEQLNTVREVPGRVLGLNDVLEAVVESNLTLAARIAQIRGQDEAVATARSRLLPRVDANLTGVIIDRDRAEASFGSAAERQLNISANLTQVLWSDGAWSGYEIQKRLSAARGHERDALILDLQLAGGRAYFNVLRAKTFERIQYENLKKTRTNLELARIRDKVGTAGPSEVLRWESQIANDRAAVINAKARRNQAEIALNQLMNRPLEEPFDTSDASAQSTRVLEAVAVLGASLDNPGSFREYRTFMANISARYAPELKQLDAVIAALERRVGLTDRAYWMPTVALAADVQWRALKGGAGSEGGGLMLPPQFPPVMFPQSDATNWSLALALSFPVFAGLSRDAEERQASAELEQRKIERRLVFERIEQRVRSSLHAAGASDAAITLSRDAATAAAKNYDIVRDAYARGAVEIVGLLDAQNAALVTEQVAASSVYDHLLDVLEVARAVSQFEFLQDVKACEALAREFKAHLEETTR